MPKPFQEAISSARENELAKLRAELSYTRDRLQTVVDEQIGIEPTLTADELLTMIYNALAEHRTQLAASQAECQRLLKALRGLLDVAEPPRWAGDNCRYCDETGEHLDGCAFGDAEKNASKALE